MKKKTTYAEEHAIMNSAMVESSAMGDLIFRNNVGAGPIAPPKNRFVASRTMTVTLKKGDVVLRSPRWIKWGLIKGASDLIGIRPTVVTRAMVGTVLGVFFGFEVKTKTGRASKDQLAFGKNITNAGAIFKIIRSRDDVAG